MTPAPRHATVFRFGPVLLFRGEQGERWRLTALFGIDGEAEPDDLRVDGVRLPVPPRHVTRWRTLNLWRFDFAAPRPAEGEAVSYGFADGPSWRFVLPALHTPPTLAYVAEAAAAARKGTTFPWHDLLRRAVSGRAHLLVLGGGQIDAGNVWRGCAGLSAWTALDATRRDAAAFTPALAEEVFAYYVERHLAFWTQPDVAAVAAALPIVAVWSDTDSGPGLPISPVVPAQVPRGVALAARRSFSLFQIGARPESPPECVCGAGTLSQGFRIGDTALMTLDPFAERPGEDLRAIVERLGPVRRRVIVTAPPLLPMSTAPDPRLCAAWTTDATATLLTPGAPARCGHTVTGLDWIAASVRPIAVPRRSWFKKRHREPPAPPGNGFEHQAIAGQARPVLDHAAWLDVRLDEDSVSGTWHTADKGDVPLP